MKNGKKTEITVSERNVDIRENFIKRYGKDKKRGEEEFFKLGEQDEKWKKLREIPCPPEYSWIYRHFMQIWQHAEYDMCGNVIFTYRTINDYVECFKVPLTVEDKKMLFKMKGWAMGVISELKEKDKEG